MKRIFTLATAMAVSLIFQQANAQYSQDFEGSEASLTGNCWSLSEIYKTTTADEIITGTGSLYTNPPTTGSATRDIMTPALDIDSTSLTISFNYKVSNKINGNATRTIEVGLINAAGVFISLSTINLDKNSPVTAQNFNGTFTVPAPGLYRVVMRLGGATGDGNSRLIFDDLYINASMHYGPSTNCNSAPVAVDDTYLGAAGLPFSSNLMANDNEPNGETMSSAIVISSPDGTVVLQPDGYFTFTPAPGFTGTTTSFTYMLTDNGLPAMNSNIATVTINFSSGMTLPVHFSSFDVQYASPDATIKWVTAQENNIDHFEIEFSEQGNAFHTIAQIAAGDEQDASKKYTYQHYNVPSKTGYAYYRIKSVDESGAILYSGIRSISLKSSAGVQISTYPNPVVNQLQLQMPASWENKLVTVYVLHPGGQVLLKKTGPASGTLTLEMNGFSRGMYIVTASCDQQTVVQKIIKQ